MKQNSGSMRPRKTAVASAAENPGSMRQLPGANIPPQKRTRKVVTPPPAVQVLGSMRPRQAAEFLGIGFSTFWRYTLLPDFPKRIKIGPRMTVYAVQDLIAWRDAQPREKGAR